MNKEVEDNKKPIENKDLNDRNKKLEKENKNLNDRNKKLEKENKDLNERNNLQDYEKNKKLCDENIFRVTSKNILEKIKKFGIENKIIGLVYIYVHFLFIFLIGFIFAFSNNIFHLCITLIVVSLDALSVVVLHGCPLTTLEKKYLNITSCEKRANNFKNANIVYTCEHEYEKQIEILINVWTLIAVKCVLLVFLKTFNFKLNNDNLIYA